MKNFLTSHWIAILSTLSTMILGVTLYAYRGDQKAMYQSVSIERKERIVSDSLLKDFIITKIENHEAIDSERNIRMDENISEIKQTNRDINDKLDKLIFSIKTD
jgi:hypothetical protein